MGKEQIAANVLNNHHTRWERTEDYPLNPGSSFQIYEIDQSSGLLPKRRSMTSHYFTKGKTRGGVIIDVDTTDIAVCSLAPKDVLVTRSLVECLGIAFHMQQTQKEYFGLKTKPIPGTDRFLLAHLPVPPLINPPLWINELLEFAMREYTILGVGVSAHPDIRPLVALALNSWRFRLKSFNPRVVSIDEEGWADRGIVITQKGGAFLSPTEPDYRRYKLHSDWKWNT